MCLVCWQRTLFEPKRRERIHEPMMDLEVFFNGTKNNLIFFQTKNYMFY